MGIDIETPAQFRITLGRVIDMLRVINATALTVKAEKGRMPVARLWETAHKMRERGYLRGDDDCLSLEHDAFRKALGILVDAGYYGLSGSGDSQSDPGGEESGYIVSRAEKGMDPSCFPVRRPNRVATAIFKGFRSENLIKAAVHRHIQTTFGLSQSETAFRAFRRLTHTYNELREKNGKGTSSGFPSSHLLRLIAVLHRDLQQHDALGDQESEKLAFAFAEFALCSDIVWRDEKKYNHLTLVTHCNYQWLLSTLFGLQTSMGDLDRVFFGGILLPGTSQVTRNQSDQEKKQRLVSSLAAVVEGRSGSGKSTFACHLGFDVARHGGVCLYLALEQWPNDLQRSFYGFGWLPEGDTFDYLGPSFGTSQQIEGSGNEPGEDPNVDPEERYFRVFQQRLEQNHREQKGIFGLFPIRPRSWEKLREWIDQFVAISALKNYPVTILMLDPFNAFVALADPPPEFSSKAASYDSTAESKQSHWVRAATSDIFEEAKYRNVNIMMVCEGEHMKDKEISHITNTSDLVFTMDRANLGPHEPGVAKDGFHVWSRYLSIRKSRFQRTLPGHHRFQITERGVSINLSPQAVVLRLQDNIQPRRFDLSLSSGFPDLDCILRGEKGREGALCRDSFTVYMGPTGCAKSELATLFLLAPVARTEALKRAIRKEPGSNKHSLLVTFRDDWASVGSVLGGPIGNYLGIRNIKQARETLTLLQLPVGFISASEILARLQKVFEEQTERGKSFGRVVFDNLGYMELMSPLLRAEPYFIHSLMTLLRQKRVSALFVTSAIDAVEKSILQAQIRDSADNVVVFDRPRTRANEVAVGTTHMAVLKSVRMEHHRERYRLSFGETEITEEEARQLASRLSEALNGNDWCSEGTAERIVDSIPSQDKELGCSVSFKNLVRDLLAEECAKGNNPKEKTIIDRITAIYRMQGFLRLERTEPASANE